MFEITAQMKYRRAECDRQVEQRLLLELEIDGCTLNVLTGIIAQLQLHFVADQAAIELEWAVRGRLFFEQRRQQRTSHTDFLLTARLQVLDHLRGRLRSRRALGKGAAITSEALRLPDFTALAGVFLGSPALVLGCALGLACGLALAFTGAWAEGFRSGAGAADACASSIGPGPGTASAGPVAHRPSAHNITAAQLNAFIGNETYS